MPVLSTGSAILLMLLVTFMWGSWFQCVKRLKGFPIPGFLLLLYTFALIFVWLFVAILGPMGYIDGSIIAYISEKKSLALTVLCSGAFMALGLQMEMVVMKNIGLVLSMSIAASFSIITRTLISCFVGGVREGFSVPLMICAVVFLIFGALCCKKSDRMRDEDVGLVKKENYTDMSKSKNKYFIIMIINTIAFAPAAFFGTAIGARTDLRPDAFPPLLCVGILATGSFIGTLICSSILLTKNKQWGYFVKKEYRFVYGLAAIAGFCHYIASLLHTVFVIPSLSIAISGPMSSIQSLWTYFWGLMYGEFKGAKKRTAATLALGIAGYMVGMLFLAMNLYW